MRAWVHGAGRCGHGRMMCTRFSVVARLAREPPGSGSAAASIGANARERRGLVC
jgi:hypothetical protein